MIDDLFVELVWIIVDILKEDHIIYAKCLRQVNKKFNEILRSIGDVKYSDIKYLGLNENWTLTSWALRRLPEIIDEKELSMYFFGDIDDSISLDLLCHLLMTMPPIIIVNLIMLIKNNHLSLYPDLLSYIKMCMFFYHRMDIYNILSLYNLYCDDTTFYINNYIKNIRMLDTTLLPTDSDIITSLIIKYDVLPDNILYSDINKQLTKFIIFRSDNVSYLNTYLILSKSPQTEDEFIYLSIKSILYRCINIFDAILEYLSSQTSVSKQKSLNHILNMQCYITSKTVLQTAKELWKDTDTYETDFLIDMNNLGISIDIPYDKYLLNILYPNNRKSQHEVKLYLESFGINLS